MSNKIEEDKRALKASRKLSNSLAKQLLNVRQQVIELTKERDELEKDKTAYEVHTANIEQELMESQEELKRVKEGVIQAMLKDYSSRNDLINDLNQLLNKQRTKKKK